jgi:riboflavin biosynthesis pyrimidine reductase
VLADDGCRRLVVQVVDRRRMPGVEVIRLPRGDWIDPADVRAALTRAGFGAVLVEGGGITIARFLEARVLTRLHVAVAPLIIGSGAPSLTMRPVDRLRDALRPPAAVYGLGPEVLFDCNLGPVRRERAAPPAADAAALPQL